MKRLVFGTGLMSPVIKGTKKITLRKYRAGAHDFVYNEVIVGEFMDGLSITLRITADTIKKRFSGISDQEAREDGFLDAEDAFNGLRKYYDGLTKDDVAAVIHFEVCLIENVPVVASNEHTAT